MENWCDETITFPHPKHQFPSSSYHTFTSLRQSYSPRRRYINNRNEGNNKSLLSQSITSSRSKIKRFGAHPPPAYRRKKDVNHTLCRNKEDSGRDLPGENPRARQTSLLGNPNVLSDARRMIMGNIKSVQFSDKFNSPNRHFPNNVIIDQDTGEMRCHCGTWMEKNIQDFGSSLQIAWACSACMAHFSQDVYLGKNIIAS